MKVAQGMLRLMRVLMRVAMMMIVMMVMMLVFFLALHQHIELHRAEVRSCHSTGSELITFHRQLFQLARR